MSTLLAVLSGPHIWVILLIYIGAVATLCRALVRIWPSAADTRIADSQSTAQRSPH
ncbi:hypothetical protein [Mycobacterium lepromatosis]|uniref:hypothetical protein n=1 Tax=Mycobacterium lepromatosis TaxID=480418 RepID=UPI000AB9930B|nr:hypothetical protein [Mycobacterium lepromatosis]